MNIVDLLRGAQGGAAIDNLAQKFGIDPSQAEAVLNNIGPEFSYRMEKNTLSRGGIADLIEMLGSGRYERYANDSATLAEPDTVAIGNDILSQVMRSKTSSRALAARASSSTGISATLIKAMLPYIASIFMGSLSKSTQGGLGDILKRLPDLIGGSSSRSSSSRKRSRKRNITQNDGPLSMPGSTRAASRDSAFPGSPLPLPGEGHVSGGDNSYGDIGDVLRRGSGGGGSTLWSIARKILGGALGFQSKGVIGWFIRMIVTRYGWRIVQAIFGRFIGAR